jgi:hypothetical protein
MRVAQKESGRASISRLITRAVDDDPVSFAVSTGRETCHVTVLHELQHGVEVGLAYVLAVLGYIRFQSAKCTSYSGL